ncbi:hypothetical protein BDQ12DRAFT_722446 [Crucibulum laeve]|uniref:Signal peptidase complex catalytic subunit SEC11 n=1 Tax=Crucibulum laeve TaxID=68775 RepID=A0A5C3M452_9AGAR|nr:hypothetical protein BDQ12DRAFT_722446 [Crucibulum laeve]
MPTKKMSVQMLLLQFLSLTSSISGMMVTYQGLGLVTNTESPVVVVLSGSMEPAFQRGDVLFLTNPSQDRYMTGDIIVYKVPGAEVPIVHRVLETHDACAVEPLSCASTQRLLTKGDNNPVDDIELYEGLEWLERKHVVGKVRGFLPFIGYITIAMNDIPQLKYALLGGLAFLSLIGRE